MVVGVSVKVAVGVGLKVAVGVRLKVAVELGAKDGLVGVNVGVSTGVVGGRVLVPVGVGVWVAAEARVAVTEAVGNGAVPPPPLLQAWQVSTRRTRKPRKACHCPLHPMAIT